MANEITRSVMDAAEVIATESACSACAFHAVARQQGHADGSNHAVVRRDDNSLAEYLGKGGGHGVVVSRAALKENHLADLPAPHNAVQIIQGYGGGQPRGQIAD